MSSWSTIVNPVAADGRLLLAALLPMGGVGKLFAPAMTQCYIASVDCRSRCPPISSQGSAGLSRIVGDGVYTRYDTRPMSSRRINGKANGSARRVTRSPRWCYKVARMWRSENAARTGTSP
jgi:hypothetical protein